ncbi:MAG: phosphoribosylamine--glycine ligase [Anaerolineae bacterium]|nr:phosphoribosylamine--glycine ligase [Anaerolineae bacterium]
MHILIVGSGGRTHAIAWKLAQSPRVSRISVAPGNGGTALIPVARNIPVDTTDVVSLLDFAETEGVDLTVIGPEEPLELGLVDQFEAVGLRIFGPQRRAALIETSKSYAKELMDRYGVPTAPYQAFTEIDPALEYLLHHAPDNVVIKADGLARGKGVFLPRGADDAEGILRALLDRHALGRAGHRVVIEQRLTGHELSVMAFSDGKSIAMLPGVRDYKRLHDHNVGPNTGGMGSVAPAPCLTPEIAALVQQRIIAPTLAGLQEDVCCFKGMLYVGLVLTQDGPVVLELNARFSDPGAQTVLPLLETDLLDIIEACVDGTLDPAAVRWRNEAAVTVMLVTAGYPDHRDSGLPVTQACPVPKNAILFHAGTRRVEDRTLTTNGRVVGLTGIGPDFPTAIRRVYDSVPCIHFEGVHYRTDIGTGAI